MFKKKIQEAFDAVKHDEEPLDEEKYRTSMEEEMEKGDFWAMILGAYRFFLPLFVVIILLVVLILALT